MDKPIKIISYPYEERNFTLRLFRGATDTAMHAIIISVYENDKCLGSIKFAIKITTAVMKQKKSGKSPVFPDDYIAPAVREFKERNCIEKIVAKTDHYYVFEDWLDAL